MTDLDRALREMLWTAIVAHPLPWRIEHDWTVEVIASDRTVVAKCSSAAEASALIQEAESKWERVQAIDTDYMGTEDS